MKLETEDLMYAAFQKGYYTAETQAMMVKNHEEHNSNPWYWYIMLGGLVDQERWRGKSALDFGSGCGRNIVNMYMVNPLLGNVDGCDISNPNNIAAGEYVKENLSNLLTNLNTRIFETNGFDLRDIQSNSYDFVMSTIVFQHICVHRIRYNLLEEIFRVLRPAGEFVVQMGFGPGKVNSCGYYENRNDVRQTNGGFDTRVDDPEELLSDLGKIGFEIAASSADPGYVITASYYDEHQKWIWVRALKP